MQNLSLQAHLAKVIDAIHAKRSNFNTNPDADRHSDWEIGYLMGLETAMAACRDYAADLAAQAGPPPQARAGREPYEASLSRSDWGERVSNRFRAAMGIDIQTYHGDWPQADWYAQGLLVDQAVNRLMQTPRAWR